MYPTLIHIFGIQITTYGLMMAIAFATFWLCTISRGQKLGYSPEFIQNLMMVIVISAFISARLLHVIVDWPYYKQYPWNIILSRDGFVFLGGFVGAVVIGSYYTRRHGYPILGVADLVAPFLALAQGIGRIGCFLFGCCYGSVCEHGLSVHFPQGSPAFYDHLNHGWLSQSAVTSLPVYPSQLFHSASNFIIFGILIFIRTRHTFRGQLAVSYLILYSLGRFITEFFRGDYRGAVGPLSTSQLIGIALFILGLVGYIWLKRKSLEPDTLQFKGLDDHE